MFEVFRYDNRLERYITNIELLVQIIASVAIVMWVLDIGIASLKKRPLLLRRQQNLTIGQVYIIWYEQKRFSSSHSIISDFASEIESEDVVCIWRILRFGNCLDGLLWRPLGVFPILASSAKISSRQYKSAIPLSAGPNQYNQYINKSIHFSIKSNFAMHQPRHCKKATPRQQKELSFLLNR